MPDSGAESTAPPSPEEQKPTYQPVWDEERGRYLPPVETRWKPGQSGNPAGRYGTGKSSLLENLRTRLSENPGPSGFGALNDHLTDQYMLALQRLSAGGLAEEDVTALQVFCAGYIALMHRIDPPKSKVDADARKRMVLLMGKPGERANLVDFMAEQQKLLAERQQKSGLQNGSANGHARGA